MSGTTNTTRNGQNRSDFQGQDKGRDTQRSGQAGGNQMPGKSRSSQCELNQNQGNCDTNSRRNK